MKRDFTKCLENLEGETLKDMDGKTDVTYKALAVRGLLFPPRQGEKPDDQDKMLIAFDLAMRIQKATEPLEITIDEAKLIKDKVANASPVFMWGQMRYFLERSEKEKKEKEIIQKD
jgi:hypothetical protein